jgi:hypothetical protein
MPHTLEGAPSIDPFFFEIGAASICEVLQHTQDQTECLLPDLRSLSAG